MNAGTVIYVGGGRVQCSTALPAFYGPGAVPFDTSGRVCVLQNGAIAGHNNGLPYGPSGRIVIGTMGQPILAHAAGLGITGAGRLACDTTAPIAGYIRGLPMTADGRVAIAPPIVVAKGLTDLDDDENPDTVLLDTPGGGPDVTRDSDSINVDVDGDGSAETVTPT